MAEEVGDCGVGEQERRVNVHLVGRIQKKSPPKLCSCAYPLGSPLTGEARSLLSLYLAPFGCKVGTGNEQYQLLT